MRATTIRMGCAVVLLAASSGCNIVDNLKDLQPEGDGGLTAADFIPDDLADGGLFGDGGLFNPFPDGVPDQGPSVCANLFGCGSADDPPAMLDEGQRVHMRLTTVGAMQEFFDMPWPHELRRKADGSLDLDLFPIEESSFLATHVPVVVQRTKGFGTTSAMMVAFDGPVDLQGSDPDAVFAAALGGEPDFVPLNCRFRPGAGTYAPGNLLSCITADGVPLRPATLYGLFITNGLLDVNGEPVAPSPLFQQLLDGDPEADAALADAYAPMFQFAAEQGVAGLVGGSVFRTADPVAGMRALADHARSLPAPQVVDLAAPGFVAADPAERGNHTLVSGNYSSPLYQQGLSPFAVAGGDITFDEEGVPVQVDSELLRFALTVPDGAMPEDGWPIVLYHHGTYGDAFSFHTSGVAYHAAAAGVAMIGIDAPLHGLRNLTGADSGQLFFNFNNPLALIDNERQAAVDLVVLERLVQAMDLDTMASPTGQAIRFDADNIFYMGHSQGGVTGPMFLAVSERVRGAVLSGAGGSVTRTLLHRVEPILLRPVVAFQLGLGFSEVLDEFEPALAVVQTLLEPADTANYAPFAYRWPGGRAFHLWMTQGLADTIVPPAITDGLAAAYGVQPVTPIPRDIPELRAQGMDDTQAPVAGNLSAPDGENYTAVYTQHADDGHFAVMENGDIERRITHWFQTLVEGTAELAD